LAGFEDGVFAGAEAETEFGDGGEGRKLPEENVTGPAAEDFVAI
jgi:hypothetical protein